MSHLWRPFSVPLQPAPMHVSRGRGSRVTDAGGRDYIDAAGGLWNVSMGLGNPRLVERMRAQLDELSVCSLFHATSSPAEELSDRLVERVGHDAQAVYLSTTGSTAVEVALRVARLHHRARGNPAKTTVVSMDRAYHGSSLMGLTASGILGEAGALSGEGLPGFVQIPSPPRESASVDALASLLARRAGEIACLIVEPVLGSAGVIVPSVAYGAELSTLCREHDVLLIADEVATGVGRCGTFLASDRLGLQPDIVALSKGINSGYFPLGCTVYSAAVLAPIAARGWPLQFGSTQDGNPVGCAAALATLDQLDQEGLCARADELGGWIKQQLRDLAPRDVVREVRGLGLMIGIELMHGDSGKAYTPAESEQVQLWCREEGLITYHFDAGLSLFPALTIGEDEVQDMLDILLDVLGRLA